MEGFVKSVRGTNLLKIKQNKFELDLNLDVCVINILLQINFLLGVRDDDDDSYC